jgi:hypothetical protein
MKNKIQRVVNLLLGYSGVEQLQLNYVGYTGVKEEARVAIGKGNSSSLEKAINSVERKYPVREDSNPELLKENLKRIAAYLGSN